MAYPFLLWAVVTLVIFTVARAFSGSGSFTATFQNIGFGMFPPTIAAAVGLLFSVLFPCEYCRYDTLYHLSGPVMGMFDLELVPLVRAARYTHQISWGRQQ